MARASAFPVEGAFYPVETAQHLSRTHLPTPLTSLGGLNFGMSFGENKPPDIAASKKVLLKEAQLHRKCIFSLSIPRVLMRMLIRIC